MPNSFTEDFEQAASVAASSFPDVPGYRPYFDGVPVRVSAYIAREEDDYMLRKGEKPSFIWTSSPEI